MKLFLLSLFFFLLAFSGLAAGLILRKKALRSGCGHAPRKDHDCRCEADLDASMKGQPSCQGKLSTH